MARVHGRTPLVQAEDADLRATEATKAPSHYIPGLDGLRALAILAVLVGHGFVQWEQIDVLSRVERGIAGAAGSLGTAGVRLFFAISGYLITSRLARELSEREPRQVLRGFYLRRFFRIIPPLVPYLTTIAIGGLLGLLPVRMSEVAAAALFATNYFRGKSWFTGHFWSLSVEEHFYLLWAPLMIYGGFLRSKWFAIAVIVLSSIARPLVVEHMRDPTLALRQTHLQLDGLMVSSLLALLLLDERLLARARSAVSVTLVSILLACLALVAAFSTRFDAPLLDPRSFEAILFGLLVVSLTLRPEFLFTRLLENRPLTWIGRRSYAIYIWQELFFIPSTESLGRKAVLFTGHVFLVLVISQVSYRWLEGPMIRVGRRLARPA
jgi:peptidoglycan/LPS O-acetylase OafA/YrhL